MTPISLLRLAILVEISLILAMVMVRLWIRLASTLTLNGKNVGLNLRKKETHVPMLELLSEPNGAHGVLSAEDHLLWGQIYKYLSSVNYNQYVT